MKITDPPLGGADGMGTITDQRVIAARCPVQAAHGVRSQQRATWQRGGTIPRAVAERAYEAYAARYGRDQSLDRLCERGGFGPEELDIFAPGWREHFTEYRLDARAS